MTREGIINEYLKEHRHDVLLNPYAGLLDFAKYLDEHSELPEGLEEASHTSSEEFVYNSATPFPNCEYIAHRTGFMAGAKWQAEQGESYTAGVIMLPIGIKKIQHTIEGFEPGDKVIVQIRKK